MEYPIRERVSITENTEKMEQKLKQTLKRKIFN